MLDEIFTSIALEELDKKNYMVNYPPPTQVVILAGGRGTRLMEETHKIPKPMLKVGDKTLLEHIIDIYSAQGLHEFIIPVGYKNEIIFDYFSSKMETYLKDSDWNHYTVVGRIGKNVITIVDTGEDTQTGGRIKQLQDRINAPFYWTYGDATANVDLHRVREIHELTDADVTLTAVHPVARFGALKLDGNMVIEFGEKKDFLSGWINGGFGLASPTIFDMIDGDETNLESEVLPYLAAHGGVSAYKHEGFWKCVDSLRDLVSLNEIYEQNGAEWLKISG